MSMPRQVGNNYGMRNGFIVISFQFLLSKDFSDRIPVVFDKRYATSGGQHQEMVMIYQLLYHFYWRGMSSTDQILHQLIS